MGWGKLVRVPSDCKQPKARPQLRNETNPAALIFCSNQNALDFVRHGTENVNRMLAANNLINVVERYRKGELEMEVTFELSVGAVTRKYQLACVAVPVPKQGDILDAPGTACFHHDAAGPYFDGIKHLVLRGITEFVHCPEGVIPSLVRLERRKEVTREPPRNCRLASIPRFLRKGVVGGSWDF